MSAAGNDAGVRAVAVTREPDVTEIYQYRAEDEPGMRRIVNAMSDILLEAAEWLGEQDVSPSCVVPLRIATVQRMQNDRKERDAARGIAGETPAQ